jgi:hypothetical protein
MRLVTELVIDFLDEVLGAPPMPKAVHAFEDARRTIAHERRWARHHYEDAPFDPPFVLELEDSGGVS